MLQRFGRHAAVVALIAAGTLGVSAQAFASPHPPTNGGNGAGQSGQCTGNPNDRPHSCQNFK